MQKIKIIVTVLAISALSILAFFSFCKAEDKVFLWDLKPIEKSGNPEKTKCVMDAVEYSNCLKWDADFVYNLGKKYSKFSTLVGMDDNTTGNPCYLTIEANNEQIYNGGGIGNGDKPKSVELEISDVIRFRVSVSAWEQCFLVNPVLTPKSSSSQSKQKPSTSESFTSVEREIVVEKSPESNIRIDSKYIQQLAEELVGYIKEDDYYKKSLSSGKISLAISPFKLIGINSKSIMEDVQEDLITELLKTKTFRIIERSQMDKIMEELKIQHSGMIDSQTAIKIGKILGTDTLLIGSISDRGTYISINCRLVNTKTGTADIGTSVKISK